jgi:hypothetical protein
MPAAVRKNQSNTQTSTTKQPAEVIMMMPKLPKRLQSLMQSDTSKVTSDMLRTSMMSLHASLPAGSFTLCHSVIRRSGRGWGVPNSCLICGDPPPEWMHLSHQRRRWQSLEHLKHALKGETRQDFEVHHGDLTRTK